MKKAWLLVLALAIVNARVIVALAVSGGDGVRESAIRAFEGEEEEEEGLGPPSRTTTS